MMDKLRSFGITDLVEKCGWKITGVFVRSYGITDATLPCASDTQRVLLLLGNHRDGHKGIRSVTAHEGTECPHAIPTFTAKYAGIKEEVSFDSADPLHVLDIVTGGCVTCCCFAGDPIDGSKDTAVEHSVAIHLDPSENSVEAFKKKHGPRPYARISTLIDLVPTMSSSKPIANDTLTNRILDVVMGSGPPRGERGEIAIRYY